MSPTWTDREPGPNCYCGMPTCVVIVDDLPSLMCIFHSRDSGTMFPLPKGRPAKWPEMTDEEMKALVDQGIAEHDAAEEKER